jgi:hypothetical protein
MADVAMSQSASAVRARGKLTMSSMSVVRRRLSWIICGWLACQLAGLAVAPFALCCDNAHALDATPACCRGLPPGQKCPMHHTGEGDRTCKMRSACGGSNAALLTLSGGIGMIPAATSAVTAFDPGERIAALSVSALPRADRPDAPPPRA